MGRRNVLVEGVSATGETSVCDEPAYQGDPATGAPVEGGSHEHHPWDVDVRAPVADHGEARTSFCGGSRNHAGFVDLFDVVLVLEVDAETLHRSGGSTPTGIAVDATLPLARVVDEILRATAPETAPPPAGTA